MRNIICGYGNIGKHILKEFKTIADTFTIYDRYISLYSNNDALSEHYDYAFVCVPTEMKEDKSCNITEVKWIIEQLKKCDVIIIKSAIPVGTADYLKQDNVVISPEYYGTTQHSLDSPGFVILGGDKKYTCKAAELYSRVKNGSFKYIFVDWRTAELAKYMENCWIAAKVTFCNEFADIAAKFNINYEELRECFVADERVNPSHTYVYRDKPYYDSHCLNKDIPALLSFCKNKGVDTPLMNAVNLINQRRKNN